MLVEMQRYVITFKGTSGEVATRYANELRNELLDAAPGIDVELQRSDAKTQDFGSTLVLILGTPAVLAAAKAMGDWLQKRHSAVIDIEKDGHVHAENLTSKDALRLVELLQSKEK